MAVLVVEAADAEPAASTVAPVDSATKQVNVPTIRRTRMSFGPFLRALAQKRGPMTPVTDTLVTPVTRGLRCARIARLYPRPMRWQVHGERVLYDSEWVRLSLVDVEIPGEIPGAHRFEHHVVRMPNQAAGTVVHDPDRGVLLLWRHRFITDTWGYEIPAGGMNPGETPEHAAAREALEETGWQPGPLRPLVYFNPTNGISDQVFHTFIADGAHHVGEPTDASESERIEWVPVPELRRIVREHEMLDGLSITAIAYALAFGEIR